jgi:RNA polymerase sigma-70 factor (ECF subfamily)
MNALGELPVLQRRELAEEDEDCRLWRALQAGDDSAFETIVVRHCAQVSSVARRLLGNAEDVEDVVQETFLRAFETRHRYPTIGCVRAWLLRITINLCKSRRRSGWWRRILLTRDYRGVEHPSRDARDAAEQSLERGRIAAAVDELPEFLRLPFMLRYFEELSGAEIAAALGWNESTVWSRIYAARRALQRRLADPISCEK